MTTTDLRALDGQIAQHLFGYRWIAGRGINLGGDEVIRRALWSRNYTVGIEQGKHLGSSYRLATGDEPLFRDWARDVPRYTTQIEHAFLVVEAMRERGYWLKLSSLASSWLAEFERPDAQPKDAPPFDFGMGEGATAPEAVVRAALAALEGE